MWEPIFDLVFTAHISINIRRPTIILDLLVLAIGFPNYFRIIFMLVFWSFYKGIHPGWHIIINKPSPAVLEMYTLMYIFVINPVCSFCAISIRDLCLVCIMSIIIIMCVSSFRTKKFIEDNYDVNYLEMAPLSSLVWNNIDVIQSSYNNF